MFFLTLFITLNLSLLERGPAITGNLFWRSFIDCNPFANATFFQLLQNIGLNEFDVARFGATELGPHCLFNFLRGLKRRHFPFIPPLAFHLFCMHFFQRFFLFRSL
ncbi:hypothetical protein D7Y26_03345 [Stenotrophomonas maltophilia]|nr:hypothetical protein [Stenotrophomonas maltophilia]MBA0322654.1 hypothetical protein [Stenotrophomonas maltophilia]